MTNPTIQQSKSNPKGKALTSLIAGIISIIPIVLLLSSGGISSGRAFVPKEMISLSFLSIVGIFLGVKGLSSTKKTLAIGGIILSIIGFLGLILLLLILWAVIIGA